MIRRDVCWWAGFEPSRDAGTICGTATQDRIEMLASVNVAETDALFATRGDQQTADIQRAAGGERMGFRKGHRGQRFETVAGGFGSR